MKLLLRILLFLLLTAVVSLLFAACASPDKNKETTDNVLVSDATAQTTQAHSTTAAALNNTADYDTYIILDDDKTTINGSGAVYSGGTLTISAPGSYFLTGSLTNGKLLVSTAQDEKVRLYLGGVTITCLDDAPLFIESSPKETIIHLVKNTVNNLTDSADREISDTAEDYATATIYSKDDLQLEGEGTLNINGNFCKGIFSKNDIDIRGGIINITSADDAIRGKDGVEISQGTLTLSAGGDAIRTSEENEKDKGSILISGGEIIITSALDAIQAMTDLEITGGKIQATCGGGATGDTSQQGINDMSMGSPPHGGDKPGKGSIGFFGPGKPHNDSSALEQQQEDTPSTKGLKAGRSLSLSDCSITVNSTDDCLHAESITVNSGTFSLSSDDDAIHADEQVDINGGDISIIKSYEGVEGKLINVSGGSIMLRASDDGFNAADPSETSDMMHPQQQCLITISDGFIHINADGDGVDSNGSVEMTGGTVIVFGPEGSGNSALDYAGQYTVSGGTLLALGSSGMAQSVTGNDVTVLAFRYSQQADILCAITDENGEAMIGFSSPKAFGCVVFASDKLSGDESYSLYQGGSFSAPGVGGVYLDPLYSPGTLIGALS